MIFGAVCLLLAGGFVSLFCNRNDRWVVRCGFLFCIAGCVSGLAAALAAFATGYGNGMIAVCGVFFAFDRLSALFQLPVWLIGGVGAIHALGYLDGHAERRYGYFWFFFNLTLAAMIWVTLALTPIEFLIAWETMGMISFALVAFEYKEKATLRAAWVYLMACDAGAAFLILMFIYGGENSTMLISGAILGMIGFGLKIGFPLLHVWLPEAHPAAPAPVSAVMSGAMINLGFYGILRMIAGADSALHILGWGLLVLGIAGALGGVLFAMAQDNLKRLLAYSSIENMGIIGMGLGLGFLGAGCGKPVMAVLGFSGAFLHLLNHAVLKGALFLAAGSVLRSAGSLRMDSLGGLLKRMPWTGSVFTFASLAISGLPPFNGFMGEFLIYLAAFVGIMTQTGAVFAVSILAVLTLALVGGLAACAFSKAVGAVFLGEPRSQNAADAVCTPKVMRVALSVPAAVALCITVGAPWICRGFAPLISRLVGMPPEMFDAACEPVFGLMTKLAVISVAVGVMFFLLLIFRSLLPRGKSVEKRGTWDCGFARPTARMEYTGTAFVQPLVDFFGGILRPKKTVRKPDGLFPTGAAISVETKDPADRAVWEPLFDLIGRFANRFHHLQSGYLHLYILVMVLALLAMLSWGFLFNDCGGERYFKLPQTVQEQVR